MVFSPTPETPATPITDALDPARAQGLPLAADEQEGEALDDELEGDEFDEETDDLDEEDLEDDLDEEDDEYVENDPLADGSLGVLGEAPDGAGLSGLNVTAAPGELDDPPEETPLGDPMPLEPSERDVPAGEPPEWKGEGGAGSMWPQS